MALAADVQTNWMPRVLGPMSVRPGTILIGETYNDLPPLSVDFMFDQDDTAIIELTGANMRVWVDDVLVTRPTVTSAFYDWDSGSSNFIPGVNTSSAFASSGDVDLWKQSDEAGGASGWNGNGYLELSGDGTDSGIRDRQISVSTPNVENTFTIIVARGLVRLRLGTTLGNDDILGERVLREGVHSIGITPTFDFYIQLKSATPYLSLVQLVDLPQAGAPMRLPTPWTSGNLGDVRWVQSGDVLFLACDKQQGGANDDPGVQQMRIERQDRTNTPRSRSWSIVKYLADDGPFKPLNTGPVQIAGSGLSGDITLGASSDYFVPGHVGGLFRLSSQGQQVSQRIQAQNEFTDPIRVTGVGDARVFQIDLIGPTFTASTTVTLQRSVATPDDWADISTYTAVQSVSVKDNLDNQIMYYRIGVKTGNFTGGDDLTASLTFSAGSIDGIVRVTGYTGPLTVAASVLKNLGSTTPTRDWYEGDWSTKNGFPSAVELYDGRLCWAGRGMEWLSIVNLFDSFDPTVQGDSGPIRRGIGKGPVDSVPWLMALNFLLLGTAGDVLVAKSSAIDTPLTPTAFSLKPVSNIGAGRVRAVPVDTNGVFISRNGSRAFQLSPDANLYSINPYAPIELTELFPDIGLKSLPDLDTSIRAATGGGFVRMAVQRHPNTRIHLIRADGSVVIVVFDKAEQVTCLLEYQTNGFVEDACVLPGSLASPAEDQVYYTVRRVVAGVTRRFREKWALESQTVGANDNRQSDCSVVLTGAQGPTISGLSHLQGYEVVAWIDGTCPLDDDGNPVRYTVNGSGQITLPRASTSFLCIGLPYVAQWRNAKLNAGSRMQAPLTAFKSITRMGLVAADMHARALRYGQSFDHLNLLAQIEEGRLIDQDYIWPAYDQASLDVDGTWGTDPRICLLVRAPLPCTVMGLLLSGEGHDAG